MLDKMIMEKAINDFVDNEMITVEKDIEKAIRYTNNELYEEAHNMYVFFIDDFYKYKTKSYIRHWEGIPGTMQGQNLYFGEDIRKNSKHPKLVINTPFDVFYKSNGGGQYRDIMYGYKNGEREISPQIVLSNVYEGIRFPFNKKMEWKTPKYKGKYFESIGNMKDSFDLFNNKFDDMAEKIINKFLYFYGYR